MKPQGSESKPLVILDDTGKVFDVAWMNRKSFTKSTEQGELWVVHDETGRVLPYERGLTPVRISDEGRWYLATVATEGGPRAAGTAVPAVTPREGTESIDERPDRSEIPRSGIEDRPAGGTPAGEIDPTGILRGLCEVISRRRSERPEGSYTTYLFDAGEEKIRKKTGEEAIELVLARSHEEAVSEAADLIYHLLVLLNQLEIPLDEVLGELARRA